MGSKKFKTVQPKHIWKKIGVPSYNKTLTKEKNADVLMCCQNHDFLDQLGLSVFSSFFLVRLSYVLYFVFIDTNVNSMIFFGKYLFFQSLLELGFFQLVFLSVSITIFCFLFRLNNGLDVGFNEVYSFSSWRFWQIDTNHTRN